MLANEISKEDSREGELWSLASLFQPASVISIRAIQKPSKQAIGIEPLDGVVLFPVTAGPTSICGKMRRTGSAGMAFHWPQLIDKVGRTEL